MIGWVFLIALQTIFESTASIEFSLRVHIDRYCVAIPLFFIVALLLLIADLLRQLLYIDLHVVHFLFYVLPSGL